MRARWTFALLAGAVLLARPAAAEIEKHGGPVIAFPKVRFILLGSPWNDPSFSTGRAAILARAQDALNSAELYTPAAEYGIGRGHVESIVVNPITLGKDHIQCNNPDPAKCLCQGTVTCMTFSEASQAVHDDACSKPYDPAVEYVVVSPPDGQTQPGTDSADGQHWELELKCPGDSVRRGYVPFAMTFPRLSPIAHEVIEMSTDPYPVVNPAWRDTSSEAGEITEVVDLCHSLGLTQKLDAQDIDEVFSLKTSDCVPFPAWGDASTLNVAIPGFGLPSRSRDVLWTDTNGTVAIWRMGTGTGAHLTEAYPGATTGSMRFQGAGDFDGDGVGDVLWRDYSGVVSIWFTTRGYLRAPQSNVGTRDSSWQVAGVGDFDGNGTSDILWRNNLGTFDIWFDANASRTAPQVAVPLEWRIATTGDFDGDGHDDILWQNVGTTANHGLLAIWYSGNTARTPAYLPNKADDTWTIVGTADFDGDRRADILWRQSPSGKVAIWYDTVMGSPDGWVPDNTWQIQTTGDFDSDGKSDILWRQTTSGDLSIWFDGRGQGGRIGSPGLAIPAEWHVLGSLLDQF